MSKLCFKREKGGGRSALKPSKPNTRCIQCLSDLGPQRDLQYANTISQSENTAESLTNSLMRTFIIFTLSQVLCAFSKLKRYCCYLSQCNWRAIKLFSLWLMSAAQFKGAAHFSATRPLSIPSPQNGHYHSEIELRFLPLSAPVIDIHQTFDSLLQTVFCKCSIKARQLVQGQRPRRLHIELGCDVLSSTLAPKINTNPPP